MKSSVKGNKMSNDHYFIIKIYFKTATIRGNREAQSVGVWLRSWSWAAGIEPHMGLPLLSTEYASPSPSPSLSALPHHCSSLSQMNE